MELKRRPRRLRASSFIRDMVKETELRTSKLMLPLFVTDGTGIQRANANLETSHTLSVDKLKEYLKEPTDLGIRSVLLFGVSDKRDEKGSEALNEDSPVMRAIKEIRAAYPELIVSTDIALDPYTDHGHDGIYKHGKILNDETVEVLCKMSHMHARAGAQIVAPSDMMDGRVAAIRKSLDESELIDTSILSYTAKYASCLYGPFRDTLGLQVKGDKKTYQMDPANRREALEELKLDVEEGADIVMVKPATWYLDIISDFKRSCSVPVAAYHVSGEAAMIEAAAKQGIIDREKAILESTTSIIRAGADIIASYFCVDLAKMIKS